MPTYPNQTCLVTNHEQARRRISVDGARYRYSTVPGSARIRLSFEDGTPIAMWSRDFDGPWVIREKGFQVFRNTGHADALHLQLLEIDRQRRAGSVVSPKASFRFESVFKPEF